MTTNGPSEDSGSKTATSDLHNNNSTTYILNFSGETLLICLVVLALVVAVLITAVVCYCRCRNQGNAHRKRKESESSNLYQNAGLIRRVDSQETVVNPPLPLSPVMNRPPAGQPEINEDLYLRPITADQFWLRRREEIERLPPPPPVFPRGLATLPVDGENAYTIVISDDEAPLLTPGPTHELTHHPELREFGEESGYVVPSSLLGNSVQQNVTGTDFSPEPREIRQNGSKMVARTVVTSCGGAERSPNMSDGRLSAGGSSVSSDTRNETERPRSTSSKIYRSSFQLFLSPPTQHRSTQVSTSTPTVVVCIRTNHDSCFTSI
jgi:hypothetical protein